MEEGGLVLERAEAPLVCAGVGLVFASFQLAIWPQLLFLLWAFATGALLAYITFRAVPHLPSALLHLAARKPGRQAVVKPDLVSSCPICGQEGCRRHDYGGVALPVWTGVNVPEPVDKALSEFLEIVLKRFVKSWHKDLVQEEGFEDELRVAIRSAAGALLQRVEQLDVPSLLTQRMLKAAAAHAHHYHAATRLVPDANEEQLLAGLGGRAHEALRGAGTEAAYFRHLGSLLLPLLLPPDILAAPVILSLVEELLARRVFVPAMNFAAKPDFVNKVLSIVFDPHSRLERTHGPPSRDVPLLERFATRRVKVPRPLHPPLRQLLATPAQLYGLMQHMKARGSILVLQTFLDLRDLASQPNTELVLDQLRGLMDGPLSPAPPHHLPISAALRHDLQLVMSGDESVQISDIVNRALNEVHSLICDFHYPQYCHSTEFFEEHLGRVAGRESGGARTPNNRRYDRWRKGRGIKAGPSMEDLTGEHSDSDAGRESPRNTPSPCPHSPPPPSTPSLPYRVELVDAVSCVEGVKPYTLYTILVRRERDDGKPGVDTVKRRFKEFMGLDAKLRQFYGDIGVTLPRKRSLRNMEQSFVDARMKDLHTYLNALISVPVVRDGQVLGAFLEQDSESGLFLPEGVGDRAGRIIKAVPGKIKRERSVFVEEFALTLAQSVESPPPQASCEMVTEVTERVKRCRELRERYHKQVAADQETRRQFRDDGEEEGEPLSLDGVMDILIYLAVDVYGASQLQLTGLLVGKVLGQSSVEALVNELISNKVSLLVAEGKAVQLIELLRDGLFFNKDPPRTAADAAARFQALRLQLASHPSPLLAAVGRGAGTLTLLSMLQHHTLNKQLFYTLLDIIVEELFPELQAGPE